MDVQCSSASPEGVPVADTAGCQIVAGVGAPRPDRKVEHLHAVALIGEVHQVQMHRQGGPPGGWATAAGTQGVRLRFGALQPVEQVRDVLCPASVSTSGGTAVRSPISGRGRFRSPFT